MRVLIKTSYVHSYCLIDVPKALKSVLTVKLRVAVHGVKVKIMMPQRYQLCINAQQQYAKCIKLR